MTLPDLFTRHQNKNNLSFFHGSRKPSIIVSCVASPHDLGGRIGSSPKCNIQIVVIVNVADSRTLSKLGVPYVTGLHYCPCVNEVLYETTHRRHACYNPSSVPVLWIQPSDNGQNRADLSPSSDPRTRDRGGSNFWEVDTTMVPSCIGRWTHRVRKHTSQCRPESGYHVFRGWSGWWWRMSWRTVRDSSRSTHSLRGGEYYVEAACTTSKPMYSMKKDKDLSGIIDCDG